MSEEFNEDLNSIPKSRLQELHDEYRCGFYKVIGVGIFMAKSNLFCNLFYCNLYSYEGVVKLDYQFLEAADILWLETHLKNKEYTIDGILELKSGPRIIYSEGLKFLNTDVEAY